MFVYILYLCCLYLLVYNCLFIFACYIFVIKILFPRYHAMARFCKTFWHFNLTCGGHFKLVVLSPTDDHCSVVTFRNIHYGSSLLLICQKYGQSAMFIKTWVCSSTLAAIRDSWNAGYQALISLNVSSFRWYWTNQRLYGLTEQHGVVAWKHNFNSNDDRECLSCLIYSLFYRMFFVEFYFVQLIVQCLQQPNI